MLFDAPQMQSLSNAYEDQPDFKVPEIVFLARSEKLTSERNCMEELFVQAPETKRKDWLGRLLSIDHEQFRSAWFEIMLFGWLKNIGNVEVEPIIEGNYPDYSVEISGQKIIVEARAILETTEDRDAKRFEAGMFWALKQIERPYTLEIIESRYSEFPDWFDFQRQVSDWLDKSTDQAFTYQTDTTTIVLKISPIEGRNNKFVSAFSHPGMPRQITSEPIKRPLREKAHQHTKIRKANYRYVIALYLEPWYLSAEEVARAWLGEEVLTIDIERNVVVDAQIDKSGIHFSGLEIRHTTVSGTLAFKGDWSGAEKCLFLRAWYIENPFARVPLDSMSFPVEARYVVIERLPKAFRMAWQKADNSHGI